MGFFRNPEIKRHLALYAPVSAVLIGLGFIIDSKCGTYSAIICFVLSLIFYGSNYHRYCLLAQLSKDIDKILHGQENISFDEYNEGELAILKNEINKMTIRLREQADTLKKDKISLTDAIADISHQLKTPLTSINLIISLLKKSDLTVERRLQLTKELERLIDRTDWLISSLLKLSKIDAGTANFKTELVSIKEVVERAVSSVAIPMDIKEQQLCITPQEKASFVGDLMWTVEAITNILKNCMEHTPVGGTIEISYAENAIYTEIVLCDNGEGIDKEDLPNLFKRFYKGKNSTDQSVGIGLALARTIIDSQNGTVKVENRIGGGAKFTIRFYKGAV